MKRLVMYKPAAALVMLLVIVAEAGAAQVEIVVRDSGGAAARVQAPVSASVDHQQLFGQRVALDRLQLVETTDAKNEAGQAVMLQFEPASPGSLRGTLWWLMPPGPQGVRRFRPTVGTKRVPAVLSACYDEARELVEVAEGALPVLRYNHGTVPPPPEIVAHFEKNRDHPLYYARGDYIHPLFGPDGQQLTDDYSLNHPHHRGVSWSWPVVRWKDEVRDLWAVRVLPTQPGGIWARPVAIRRAAAGPVLAAIDAENVWKWADQQPIVREEVVIRAFRATQRHRFVDVEVRLTALAEGVAIGGRPGAGYGGFALRTFPAFEKRQIAMYIEPPEAAPRRAWFHLTGVFPGGKGPAGVAMFEHVTNLGYPNYPDPEGLNRVPDQYPPWRCVLPSFPGAREVPLPKGESLVLKHRLWIHPGFSSKAELADAWATYAQPPEVVLSQPRSQR